MMEHPVKLIEADLPKKNEPYYVPDPAFAVWTGKRSNLENHRGNQSPAEI